MSVLSLHSKNFILFNILMSVSLGNLLREHFEKPLVVFKCGWLWHRLWLGRVNPGRQMLIHRWGLVDDMLSLLWNRLYSWQEPRSCQLFVRSHRVLLRTTCISLYGSRYVSYRILQHLKISKLLFVIDILLFEISYDLHCFPQLRSRLLYFLLLPVHLLFNTDFWCLRHALSAFHTWVTNLSHRISLRSLIYLSNLKLILYLLWLHHLWIILLQNSILLYLAVRLRLMKLLILIQAYLLPRWQPYLVRLCLHLILRLHSLFGIL